MEIHKENSPVVYCTKREIHTIEACRYESVPVTGAQVIINTTEKNEIPEDSDKYFTGYFKYAYLTYKIFVISLQNSKYYLSSILLVLGVILCIITQKIFVYKIIAESELLKVLGKDTDSIWKILKQAIFYDILGSILRETYTIIFGVYINTTINVLSNLLFSTLIKSSKTVSSVKMNRIVDRGNKSVLILLSKILLTIASKSIFTILILKEIYDNGWDIFMIVLGFNIVYVLVTYVFIKNRIKYKKVQNKYDDLYNSKILECVSNLQVIRSNGTENTEASIFTNYVKYLLNARYKDILNVSMLNLLQKSIYIILIVVLVFKMVVYDKNINAIGATLLRVLYKLDKNIMEIALAAKEMFVSYIDCEEYLNTIYALQNSIPEELETKVVEQIRISRSIPVLEFKNIYFSYKQLDTPVFKDVSFHINDGEKICIVGKSGSGKSTLLSLLLKNYKFYGNITLFGTDISQLTKDQIVTLVGIVPQDSGMFNNTIEYNIKYGSTPSESEYQKVVNALCLDEIAATKRNGYNYIIGESGNNLSGGEKQRIALARTILRNPKIIILDESTSKIDYLTEEKILKYIFSLNKTVILLTHSPAVAELADRIIIINQNQH
ncbi:hypothetical protein NEOKW01_1548 [Nematocida sp. AWRm80]|nr:hypothetical protein NEOKW01_1548 [Nematocida sp. AWRm80]